MAHIDLLELPYFQGISIDSLVGLIDVLKPAEFAPGAAIIQQNQSAPPPLYVITRGKVAIVKTLANGQERTLAERSAPTLVGEVELFCQLSPVASVRTLDRVSAFELNRTTFNSLFKAQNPAIMQFTFNVARVACHRLALADEMLARTMDENNLVQLRHSVYSSMSEEQDLTTTTGAFRIPSSLKDD